MGKPHLDNRDDIRWFPGQRPATVLEPCPHDCRHESQRVIAWGTDMQHYELIQCDADCGGTCRSWTDGSALSTTAWLHVAEGT